MTKSELIEAIARKQKHLPAKDVELAVKHLLEGLFGKQNPIKPPVPDGGEQPPPDNR